MAIDTLVSAFWSDGNARRRAADFDVALEAAPEGKRGRILNWWGPSPLGCPDGEPQRGAETGTECIKERT